MIQKHNIHPPGLRVCVGAENELSLLQLQKDDIRLYRCLLALFGIKKVDNVIYTVMREAKGWWEMMSF